MQTNIFKWSFYRQDQRVRFVVRSHPSEIRAKIESFRAVLANVTGAIVNVDALEAHGTADKTKTDVLLHFVHKRCLVEKISVLFMDMRGSNIRLNG